MNVNREDNQKVGWLKEINMTLLRHFNVPLKLINELRFMGVKTLYDLKMRSSKSLAYLSKVNSADVFAALDQYLYDTPLELYESLMLSFKSNTHYLSIVKRAEGFTLQEVGDLQNLTRERIRQIVIQISKTLTPLVLEVVKQIKGGQNYLTEEKINSSLPQGKDALILAYCLKLHKEIDYFDFAETFYLFPSKKGEKEKQLKKALDEIIAYGENLLDVFSEIEQVLIKLDLDFMHIDDIKRLLEKNKYRFYGNFVAKGRVPYGYLGAKIVRDYFPQGVKLNQNKNVQEEDLVRVRELLEQKYKLKDLPESDRALGARLSEHLIISGRGYVTAIEHVKIDKELLTRIIKRIDASESEKIYYMILFNEFQEELKARGNIDNYYFLHGVLMHFYPDRYDYFRDYLVKKCNSSTRSGLIQDTLLEYINTKGRAVHKNEIKKVFGFSDIMMYSAMELEHNIIQWQDNYYFSLNLLDLKDADLVVIKESILEIFAENKDYCSAGMLYHWVKAKSPEMIKRLKIENYLNLFYIALAFFADSFDMRRPHICKQGKFSQLGCKEIVLSALGQPKLVQYSEFMQVFQDYHWPNVTAYTVFQEIEGETMRISRDKYLFKDSYELDLQKYKQLEEAILAMMEHDFYSLHDFSNWDDLPDLGYPWTVFFLSSLIKEYGQKLLLIEPKANDRRYQRGLIVKASTNIQSYDDLIAKILETKGISSISEGKLLSLLSDYHFAYQNVPKDIYNSSLFEWKKGVFTLKKEV